MSDYLFLLWQAPQYITGNIYRLFVKTEYAEKYFQSTVYFINAEKFGISFGCQIFLSNDKRGKELLPHEYGHSRQSRILGVFYLPVICVLGLARYLVYERKVKKAETNDELMRIRKWYFNGFPENWANRLGNVSIDDWEWY
jgi:hypothetical protein